MEITTLDYLIDCFIGKIGELLTSEVKPGEVRGTLPKSAKVTDCSSGINRNILCVEDHHSVRIALGTGKRNELAVQITEINNTIQDFIVFPASTPANIIAGYVVSRFR